MDRKGKEMGECDLTADSEGETPALQRGSDNEGEAGAT
jgi:hypothetical protein